MNLFLPAALEDYVPAKKPAWKADPRQAGVFTYKDRLLSPSGIYKASFKSGPAETRVSGSLANAATFRRQGFLCSCQSSHDLINHSTNGCWELRIDNPTSNTAYPWGRDFQWSWRLNLDSDRLVASSVVAIVIAGCGDNDNHKGDVLCLSVQSLAMGNARMMRPFSTARMKDAMPRRLRVCSNLR